MRIIQQQGIFLYGADFKSSFLCNLYEFSEEQVQTILNTPIRIKILDYQNNKKELIQKIMKSRSIKIIFSEKINIFIGKELRAMNINMKILFPDVYGFIQNYYEK